MTSRHSPSCATDKTLLHASTSDSRAVISGSSRRQRVSEVSPLRMSTPTVGPRRMRMRMRMRGRNAKQPLLLIHRHGNKMSGETGGLKCARVRQKNVCSHLSRLSCGSSNLRRAPLTPDLHVLLKSSTGCFHRFPAVNATRKGDQERSLLSLLRPSVHTLRRLFLSGVTSLLRLAPLLCHFSKPTCLRRSSLF